MDITWDENNVASPESIWDENNEFAHDWPADGARTALIDADLFPYIIGFTSSELKFTGLCVRLADKGLEKDSPEWLEAVLRSEEGIRTVQRIKVMLTQWVVKARCDSARLFLTDCPKGGNYREKIAFLDEYKGNRKNSVKPPFFSFIKWYLAEHMGAEVSTDREADDAMSRILYQHIEDLKKQGAEGFLLQKWCRYVIVSIDKDLRMIQGWHCNPRAKFTEALFWANYLGHLEAEYKGNTLKEVRGTGMKFFWFQVLAGDMVDNYKGLPQVGKGTAYKLLADCESAEECQQKVIEAYQKKYPVEREYRCWNGGKQIRSYMDMLVEQGRLAWMLKGKKHFMHKHKLPELPEAVPDGQDESKTLQQTA